MPSKPLSKVEIAYGLLKDSLLAGRIAQGQPLRIDQLDKAYGLGATPIREALARLEPEGLVEQKPKRGFFATRISAEDFEDLIYTRITLERALIVRAIERGDDVWEASVITAHHLLAKATVDLRQLDARIDQWQDRHVAFHMSLVAGSGAKRLVEDYRRAFEHIRRHQMALLLKPAVASQEINDEEAGRKIRELERRMNIAEHTRLMEAVLSRDVPRALQAVEEHLGLMPLELIDDRQAPDMTGNHS
ncbi:GntR family transcriptional regulator [Chelativorans intermedius]|uniref:GntR family transcriptional regulator n=1 Tax=Chelativorans intermedius TaxID=515947 RepID=A0ABV6D9Q6_9HYPH|nr:GntR family transcriptional regulator [Chelativorans intermedius]MCT8999128.1 GntR family transcriptional regulator [Chelativorans intermedius]